MQRQAEARYGLRLLKRMPWFVVGLHGRARSSFTARFTSVCESYSLLCMISCSRRASLADACAACSRVAARSSALPRSCVSALTKPGLLELCLGGTELSGQRPRLPT